MGGSACVQGQVRTAARVRRLEFRLPPRGSLGQYLGIDLLIHLFCSSPLFLRSIPTVFPHSLSPGPCCSCGFWSPHIPLSPAPAVLQPPSVFHSSSCQLPPQTCSSVFSTQTETLLSPRALLYQKGAFYRQDYSPFSSHFPTFWVTSQAYVLRHSTDTTGKVHQGWTWDCLSPVPFMPAQHLMLSSPSSSNPLLFQVSGDSPLLWLLSLTVLCCDVTYCSFLTVSDVATGGEAKLEKTKFMAFTSASDPTQDQKIKRQRQMWLLCVSKMDSWPNPFILKIGYPWVGKTLTVTQVRKVMCFFFKLKKKKDVMGWGCNSVGTSACRWGLWWGFGFNTQYRMKSGMVVHACNYIQPQGNSTAALNAGVAMTLNTLSCVVYTVCP